MMNTEIFEEIFWTVGEENNLTNWWEIFDSEVFEEVERRVAERFNVTEACEVEGFCDWSNEMAWEL